MKKFNYLSLLTLSTFILFTSCDKDDPIVQEPTITEYKNGIFVTCEGGFGSNNASVQFIDIANATIHGRIYSTANNEDLGDVLQSITFENDQAYLVLNGTGKITVVEQSTFKKLEKSQAYQSPRYLKTNNDKGYVTNLYSPYIQIVDMNTNVVVDSIDLGEQSDKFILEENQIWVISPKEWQGRDKKHIYTVNTTDQSVDSLEVGYNPSNLVFNESNDVLYVYCSGKEEDNGSEGAQIVSIDIQTNAVIHTQDLGYTNQGSQIAVDQSNNRLLFSKSDGIYAYDTNSQTIATSPIISLSDVTYLYGLNVNPTTGEIFIGDAKDFNSAGEIKIYNSQGALGIQNPVDVGPNGFYFE